MNSSLKVTPTNPTELIDTQTVSSRANSQAELGKEGVVHLFDQYVPYATAWQWQRQLVERYKSAIYSPSVYKDDATEGAVKKVDVTGQPGLSEYIDLKDRLLLLQHLPVYTLGQGADTKFLQFDASSTAHEIHRVERGGEVTYHCPGQLVGYPILNLRTHKPDLHWYLRQLEEVLIRTLVSYGLAAERIPGLTGVWYKGHKLAAIGIKVSRWITMHGFALNVCPDLSGFDRIVPCGLTDRAVGSMAQFLPDVEINAVRQVVIAQFAQVFGMQLETVSGLEI